MNDLNIFNIDRETEKSLRVFWLIFGTFLIGIIIYSKVTEKETVKNQLLNSKINVKVVNIYKNRDEHNFIYVKFSNGKEQTLNYPYKIGDSISKKRNDSIEYIFRNGKIIKYNVLEYWRKNNE